MIRTEKKRSNVTTLARIQPCLKNLATELGSFNGKEFYPRLINRRDIKLYLYNNHFCLICKSQGVSFNQATEELKVIFKMIDSYTTEENVNVYSKYELTLERRRITIDYFFVFDLETLNTNKARRYNFAFVLI